MRNRACGLAVMLALSAPAAAASDASESWEPPIIGWRCSDGMALPGNRRVALHASTISADPTDRRAPLKYEFVVYRDDPLNRLVDAYVTWIDLDGSGLADPHKLYFTLRGKLPRRGVVKFRGDAGNEISVPARSFKRYEDSISRKAYINITDRRLISEFLKSSSYAVSAGDALKPVRLGELSLFSHSNAAEHHALLQRRMRARIAYPETECTAVRAPEPTEADIL